MGGGGLRGFALCALSALAAAPAAAQDRAPPADLLAAVPDADGRALVERAWRLAEEAHRGQTRDQGTPFIEHPEGVARILALELGVRDARVLAAALLHDVVEDTRVRLDEVRSRMGEDVAAWVDALTWRKDEAREAYLGRVRGASPEARRIKLADRLHNLREAPLADPARRARMLAETRAGVLPWSEATDPYLHREILRALEAAGRPRGPGVVEVLGRRVRRLAEPARRPPPAAAREARERARTRVERVRSRPSR